jgi:hypothetical protein
LGLIMSGKRWRKGGGRRGKRGVGMESERMTTLLKTKRFVYFLQG